ncbi:hypothetical protein [Acetobacterium sp.]|uniref:hypothetical protein n=1 Tax=Acetobacterium sp. TaxID=1872094 RepID=UPI002F3E5DEC
MPIVVAFLSWGIGQPTCFTTGFEQSVPVDALGLYGKSGKRCDLNCQKRTLGRHSGKRT